MKGSPVIPIRIPVELLAQVDEACERSAATRRGASPFNRSSFILAAIIDKLKHQARSNGHSTDTVVTTFARDQFPGGV